jgi:hypothetical protein
MSFTRLHDFKSEIVPVELKKIMPHDLYGDFNDLLATANYMLPSNGIMTEQALALSLIMHPIVVIYSRRLKDRYYCVGGIRSLLLAKSTQSLDAILSVTLVRLQRVDEIELAVKADMLLSPLLMSIRSPATIGAIHQMMRKEDIEALFIKGMHRKSIFSAQMGSRRNTVFPPRCHSSEISGEES